jgi:hypothetical protein
LMALAYPGFLTEDGEGSQAMRRMNGAGGDCVLFYWPDTLASIYPGGCHRF